MQSQRSSGSNSLLTLAVGSALAGAGAMYFADPQSGRRRRAFVADQINRLTNDTQDFLRKANIDARERARGLYRQSTARLRATTPDERTLEERVRSELGRCSTHPHAIHVECSDGTARLTGNILEREVEAVVSGVKRVPDVKEVINELQVHATAENIPALQGGNERSIAPRFEYLQDHWSPAPRILAGTAGLALLALGLRQERLSAVSLSAIAGALLVRTLTNRSLADLIGIGEAAESGIVVQKTIHVYAEPDEAYAAWRDLESFPRFMSHVREVTRTGDRQYRWKVDGPGNVPITWDAEVIADVPGELIAWRTVPESPVQNSGLVQFESTSVGGTRIHVRMIYRPPANAVGHTIAKVFGRDPKRQIDDDLLRFKSFLESGRPTSREQQFVRH